MSRGIFRSLMRYPTRLSENRYLAEPNGVPRKLRGTFFFFDIYPWHTLFCFPEEIHRIHHFGSSSLYSCPVLIRRNNINSHLFNEPIIFFRAYGKKFAFGTLKKFLQKNSRTLGAGIKVLRNDFDCENMMLNPCIRKVHETRLDDRSKVL